VGEESRGIEMDVGDVRIHPIALGADCCYFIRGKSAIMIDGGAPKRARVFLKAIERLSMKPEEIRLMIITHGHWDHIGSAGDIKEITGAKIAMHHREKDWLEKCLKPIPPGVTGWGRILVAMMAMLTPLVRIPATSVDIVLPDEGFSLSGYGIPGEVIHTPGHSPGSVSVLLETGDVFVGDLAMNGFPLRHGPGLPIFAEDLEEVRRSWKLLLDRGAKTVYPAHGKPFSVDIIRRTLAH